MKNPLTPAGIESSTFRFVAHHLNHCATAVLYMLGSIWNLKHIIFEGYQWPRNLRCVSEASRLLGLQIRIPTGAWVSLSCESCVSSGRVSASG